MVTDKKCSFAHPGTYGHECGEEAVLVAVKPSKLTINGLYYGARCANCAAINGGENTDVIRFEKLDVAKHGNHWSR